MKDIICFDDRGFHKKLGFTSVINCKDLEIVFGGSERVNRNAVENNKVDILVNAEKSENKDLLHYRNSGLNQVLCKLANQNNVAIGFSFSEILRSKERSVLIGRIMQNIKLCGKYNVRMVFATFAKNKYEMRDARDLIGFCRVLKMTGKEAKEALNFGKS